MHVQRGDDVILVGLEGSPSMGVHVTSSDPLRGGRPEWPEGTDELAPGSGIFIEELTAELAERGDRDAAGDGVSHQLPDHSSRPSGRRSPLMGGVVEGDRAGSGWRSWRASC